MGVKVKNVENVNGHIVCKGKLILLSNNIKNTNLKDELSFLKPITISETEEIEVGDKVFHSILEEIRDYYPSKHEFDLENSCKVLVLPEQFSSEYLEAIVSGDLKDGEKVYVKCEEIRTNPEEPDSYALYENHVALFLPEPGSIRLFSVKKEESWDTIEEIFTKTDTYKFTTARNIGSAFIMWLKDNYNPPTRKDEEIYTIDYTKIKFNKGEAVIIPGRDGYCIQVLENNTYKYIKA